MKRLLIYNLIILTAIYSNFHSQSYVFRLYQSDHINGYKYYSIKDFNAHGKVKSIIYSDTSYQQIIEFNKEGQLTKVIGSDSLTLLAEYDKKGNLKRVNYNNPYTSLTNEKINFSYNKKGKLLNSVLGCDERPKVESKVYEYNKKGDIDIIYSLSNVGNLYDSIREKYHYKNGIVESIDRTFHITRKEMHYTLPADTLSHNHTESFEYYENGEIKKSSFKFKTKMRQLPITKFYTVNGDISIYYEGDTTVIPDSYILKKYSYNKEGFLEEFSDKGIADGAYNRLEKHVYEYDKEGNWISKNINILIKRSNFENQYIIDENRDPIKSSYSTQRTIIYY